jgi:hypothetical protein
MSLVNVNDETEQALAAASVVSPDPQHLASRRADDGEDHGAVARPHRT